MRRAGSPSRQLKIHLAQGAKTEHSADGSLVSIKIHSERVGGAN